eukprot:754287-Hanusia_phi.AAC.5
MSPPSEKCRFREAILTRKHIGLANDVYLCLPELQSAVKPDPLLLNRMYHPRSLNNVALRGMRCDADLAFRYPHVPAEPPKESLINVATCLRQVPTCVMTGLPSATSRLRPPLQFGPFVAQTGE